MEKPSSSDRFSCPSAPLYKNSELLGIVNENGEVDLLTTPLELDDDFIAIANAQEKKPEERFRFTNKCVKSGCAQWKNNSCGVVATVLEKIESDYWKDALPDCGIRNTCRWFFQEKEKACKVCTLVRYAY